MQLEISIIVLGAFTVAHPQDFAFAPLNPQTDFPANLIDTTTQKESSSDFEFSTTTAEEENAIPETPSFSDSSAPQCLYDFKGNRGNKGCGLATPTCSNGTLVQTVAGSSLEMCCCNYSNFP